MENNSKFTWIPFYMELADKLIPFKSNREQLIQIVLRVYEKTGIKLPTLERDNDIVDIDPFSIYGLFNKQIKEENRIAIAEALGEELNIEAETPSDFDGIPVMNNMNATFYYFRDLRQPDDIDNLWNLFEAALWYADDPLVENKAAFEKAYDKTLKQKGILWNITMGLYWIRPYVYIALDSRNRWYMSDPEHASADIVSAVKKMKSVPEGRKYLGFLRTAHDTMASGNYGYSNIPELSFASWTLSEEVNARQAAEKKATENALGDTEEETTHYWLYSPGDGAKMWDECLKKGFMVLGWDEIGDISQFATKEEVRLKLVEVFEGDSSYKNSAHAVWQFANEMKPGDVVFAKRGMHTVIGRGVVESDYYYDSERDSYKNVRKVKWNDVGDRKHPGQAVMKTLTDITQYTEYVQELNSLYEIETVDPSESLSKYEPYGPEDFLEEVYMTNEEYHSLVALIRNKKNVILQGAPGVGKTFAARRLAYSMMGEKDKSRVQMVQFHQSYSYEDFIMGFRPTETGFELKKGAFYNFCKDAEIDSDNEYFFIIDEINRGNLSKIFGELFMLIENDKRGVQLQLLYSNEKFSVPKNVYIIGMMNTADRSLAMLDYALRRRFAFYEMKPGFDTDGFIDYQESLESGKFNALIDCVKALNDRIANDDSLGEGFCIGHSYFCNLKEASDDALNGIVKYELVPLLKEYWFDEPSKVKEWTDRLKRAIS